MCLSCCLYYAGGLRNLLTDSGLHRTMRAELSDLEKFFRVAHMLNDKKRKIQQNDKKHSMYFSFFLSCFGNIPLTFVETSGDLSLYV